MKYVFSFFFAAALAITGCSERGRAPATDSGLIMRVDGGSTTPDGSVPSTCSNGVRDGDETTRDCGGSCPPCADGQMCVMPADCQSGVCRSRFCLMPSCSDGVVNGRETGVDCGGDCDRCPGGQPCSAGSDCLSLVCLPDGTCEASSCEDGVQNNEETGTDCGGPTCPACPGGEACVTDDDCASFICQDLVCTAATCDDRVQNQDETSIDCGGATCDPCRNGLGCELDTDCIGMRCDTGMCVSCDDGIQNGDESDVDCGGTICDFCEAGDTCAADSDCGMGSCIMSVCVTCSDGVQNQDETDVDCGGATCTGCDTGQMCAADTDCTSSICDPGTSTCNAPGCGDGVLNGLETDLDCGGGTCIGCADGLMCTTGSDCLSGVCTGGVCQAPTCTDGVANGDETDVDCGGATTCPRCMDYRRCTVPGDCTTGMCTMGICGDTGCIPFTGTSTDTFGYFGCSLPLTPTTVSCPNIDATGTGTSLGDDGETTAALGFSFDFYGTTFTSLTIGANGAIDFDTASISFSNSCMGTTSVTNFIAAFWDDLYPGRPGSSVVYQTVGAAPNRQFVVTWDVEHFSSSPSRAKFTLVLEETTNDVKVCYLDTDFGTSSYNQGLSATAGIRGTSTANSLQFSCNTADLVDGLEIRYIHP